MFLSLYFHDVGPDELHCPKCRVVTRLPSGGVIALSTNYALREVAEALEDDVPLAPSLGSMGHQHPNRQQSGMLLTFQYSQKCDVLCYSISCTYTM